MGRFSSSKSDKSQYPILGDESIMSKKAHGTSETGAQKNLRWNVEYDLADRICNFNRHYAEGAGSFLRNNEFLDATKNKMTEAGSNPEAAPMIFYDSNTGYPLFQAPVGRSWDDFMEESRAHGWPSFRDEEVIWDRVRVLPDGECVSLDGTHLGHDIPDRSGNRYCINLCSVAGKEGSFEEKKEQS